MVLKRLLSIIRFLIIKIRSNIRIKLIIVFIISITAGIITNILVSEYFTKKNIEIYYSYRNSYEEYKQYMDSILTEIRNNQDFTLLPDDLGTKPEKLNVDYVNKDGFKYDSKLKLLNQKIDIYDYLRRASDDEYIVGIMHNGGKFVYIAPIQKGDYEMYLIGEGELALSREEIQKYNGALSIFGLTIFYLSFYFLTRTKIKQLEKLSKGFQEVALGNLSFRAKVKGVDEVSQLADQMNRMMDKLQKSLDEEQRLQTFKTDLITNVSHDLRTPLTSIIGYLNLIKEGHDLSETEKNEYTEIVLKKADQLSTLVNDLFEYTKLSNKELPLTLEPIAINHLIAQMLDEYEHLFMNHQMTINRNFGNDVTWILADSQKLVRLFENLFRNAMEHGEIGGDFIISIDKSKSHVVKIYLENPCGTLTEAEENKLFERFYKKDQSRSKGTGSGLGLAIAKEIVELHDGKIRADVRNNRITFVVEFPVYSMEHVSSKI